MKRIKPFMRNKCNHRHCKECKCANCPEYNPYFLSIRINKKLANVLYAIEYWLVNYEFPEVFW